MRKWRYQHQHQHQHRYRQWLYSFGVMLLFLFLPSNVFANEAEPVAFVTTVNLNLREEPNTESNILITAPRNTVVWVTGFMDGEWYTVVCENLSGYMKSEFLSESSQSPDELLNGSSNEPVKEPSDGLTGPLTNPEDGANQDGDDEEQPITWLEGWPDGMDFSAYESNVPESVTPESDTLEASATEPDISEAAETAETAETSTGAVELISWSDAKKIFKTGQSVQVIDVRTGITYQVASFSNGKHADVEPVTSEDTAAMKRTYGGSWSWDTRPILVVINGRTLAASINGMPHGGGVNNQNNMNGQVCIHFQGSKTHNGNTRHERDHQNAVTEAYNAAKSW